MAFLGNGKFYESKYTATGSALSASANAAMAFNNVATKYTAEFDIRLRRSPSATIFHLGKGHAWYGWARTCRYG